MSRADRRYALTRSHGLGARMVARQLWSAHGTLQRLRRGVASRAPDALASRLAPVRRTTPAEDDLLGRALGALPSEIGAPVGVEEWVMVGDCHAPERDRVLALRIDAQARPDVVLKITASALGRSRLEREAIALRGFVELPGGLRASLPALLAHVDSEQLGVLALAPLPGRSQYVDLHADFFPERLYGNHLRRAAEWLAAFHHATRQGHRDGVPLAARHGDFWPGNVVQTDRHIGVIDWECFEPLAPVTDDLLDYALAYLRVAKERGLARGVSPREWLLASGSRTEAMREFFDRYCQGVGIPREALEGPIRQRLARPRPRDPFSVAARGGSEPRGAGEAPGRCG